MLTMLTLASVCAFAAPTFQEEEQTGPPLVSLEELVLEHYTPQHVSRHELSETGTRMVGRNIYIKERGGFGSPPVSNLSMLGDNLVLYDTQEYVARMKQSLQALDQPGAEKAGGSGGPLVTVEYTPKFIALDVALNALGSFQRLVKDRDNSGYQNLSFARERGLLVVRETASRAEEIIELLKRIDTPKPQVMITCYLLQGADADVSGSRLPTELTSNLSKLVPGQSFEQIGFGMLQASVVHGGYVSLKLDTNQGGQYELSFNPMAYDTETNSLTVVECSLMKKRSTQAGAVSSGDPRDRIFTTDTLFRGNEYTVLGASGLDPIFVVVRVAPIGA